MFISTGTRGIALLVRERTSWTIVADGGGGPRRDGILSGGEWGRDSATRQDVLCLGRRRRDAARCPQVREGAGTRQDALWQWRGSRRYETPPGKATGRSNAPVTNYVCVCVHATMYGRTCVCMYVRMYVRMYVCMHACTYVCMYVCM